MAAGRPHRPRSQARATGRAGGRLTPVPVFKPAAAADAVYWADLESEAHPDEPWDPDVLEYEWRFEDRDQVARRWNLEAGGSAVGFAQLRHARWERTAERFVFVEARVRPVLQAETLLAAAYDELEQQALGESAATLQTLAREDDAERVAFLEARGYRRDRLERSWELDLVANQTRVRAMAERSRARMREAGIELLTLDRWDEPETYRQLYELDMQGESDIPSTDTFVPHDFEDWRLWFTKPGLYRDRFWLARREARLLGLSVLLFPRRGPAVTDLTAVAREARGQGIARALKCETLVQAIALGVPAVRTMNDAENAPILHLNEDLGYVQKPAWILFSKDVS